MSVAYNGLTEADADALMDWCYNANDKYIKVYSPVNGSQSSGHFFKTLQGYVSQVDCEWVQTGKEVGRWNIDFSFIEGRR